MRKLLSTLLALSLALSLGACAVKVEFRLHYTHRT